MALYFFDIDDGSSVLSDEAGMELPDLNAAVRAGTRAATDLAKDLFMTGTETIEVIIRMSDIPLMTIRISKSVIFPG